ncbi:alkaline shock response membrane anchor protein AmaP [Pseudonocardiaceae bacterium YIM PH 21723]|nr:alkaline shock response membrane anchor protein AmaP [Pseudonocardiaceae bacterium YIM PH 21723]
MNPRLRILLFALLFLAAGTTVLLVGHDVFGYNRAGRPVLDPIAMDLARGHRRPALYAALAIGALAGLTGLRQLLGALRREPQVAVELPEADGIPITVTGQAIGAAVAEDATGIDGVSRAQARMTGDGLRLRLWLAAGTDVRSVWAELDDGVLARARQSIGRETLPTSVHLEIETTAGPRVR